MKKKTRIFVVILILIISLFIGTKRSFASTNNEVEILEYDAKTNNVRSVNIDEMQNVIQKTTGAEQKNVINRNSLELTSLAKSISTSRILNTNIFPYRQTCRVIAQTENNTTFFGSAAIVGPKVVLTAAHCVFDVNNNKAKLLNWKIQPGYNYGDVYGPQCGWDKVYYTKNWMQDDDAEYDWAICVLEQDVGSVGSLIAQSYSSNSEIENETATVLGYPVQQKYGFSGDYQYKSGGDKIVKAYENYFTYNGFICEGFSGGPILRSDNVMIGIQARFRDTTSYGIRISQDIVNVVNAINSGNL